MKTIRLIMYTIATFLLCTAIYERNNVYMAVFYTVVALSIIIYVIITVRSKNRLERKIRDNEDTQSLRRIQAEYYTLGIAHEELIDENNQLEIDLANCKKRLDGIQIPVKPARIGTPYIVKQDLPFTEEIKECSKCGASMNKRTKYWVCSNCKSRKKIEEE